MPDSVPAVAAAAPPKLPAALAGFHLARDTAPTIVTPPAAAASLVTWMQENGYTGWLAVDELDAAWEVHRDELNAFDIPLEVMREQVLGQPGVRKIRARLTGDPQFGAVRHRLKIRRRPYDRATLFWIPDQPVAVEWCSSAEPVAAPSGARAAPATGRPARSRNGHRAGAAVGKGPANPEKTTGCQPVDATPVRRRAA